MKGRKRRVHSVKIYCDDLEKTIDREGCYNALGSTVCRACPEKPLPRKAQRAQKEKPPG
jgi:hypothetical protein